MNNCLQCGKEINQSEGKRERKFCNSTCRTTYWMKNNKEKKPKYVRFKSFQDLKEQFDKVIEENKMLKLNFQKATKESFDGKETNKAILDEAGQSKNINLPENPKKETITEKINRERLERQLKNKSI